MYARIGRYIQELARLAERFSGAEQLKQSSILITGASGLVGSPLVDFLMYLNETNSLDIRLKLMSRDVKRLRGRFLSWVDSKNITFIEHDINEPLLPDMEYDYIIHAASNALPHLYVEKPVQTFFGNVDTTRNLFEHCKNKNIEKFLFVSSGEVYGKSPQGVTEFSEEFQGSVSYTDLRNIYPVSKAASEALCAAYSSSYGICTTIVRPCHIYGPTMTSDDNRVFCQFLRDAVNGHDIRMKSIGSQVRSYCYVFDCASALLSVLLKGRNQTVYNISNRDSVVSIRELAQTLSEVSGSKVAFVNPTDSELNSYSSVEYAVLNHDRLSGLGWRADYDIQAGVRSSFEIYKAVCEQHSG